MRSAAAVAAIISIGVLGTQRARAQNPPHDAPPASPRAVAEHARRVQDAVRLHNEARTLYLHGDYKKAIEKLEAALALDPNAAELVYNLGLLHEKLLEFDAAETYYRHYLEMETDPKLIDRVQTTLKRIEGAKKELEDRKRAAAPPPAASAPPASPPSAPAATADAAPKRGRPGPAFWVAGSVAAAGAVGGTAFAIAAVMTNPSSDTRTGGGVTVSDLQDEASAAHTRAIIADVSFLVAGLAAGVAVYFYVKRPHPSESPRARALAPVVSSAPFATAIAPARGAVLGRF